MLLRLLVVSLLLSASAARDEPLPEVPARAETVPPTGDTGDRADDVAIWRNADDPPRSLLITTDKMAGIAIHDLAGRLLSFQPLGKLNNVDLRADVTIAGRKTILVAASDRSDKRKPRLQLFRLDPTAPALIPIGTVNPPRGEAYGLCLHQRGDGVDAFMIYKQGIVEQIALDLSQPVASGRVLRRFNLKHRSEGCVADDRTGTVYVAEDKVAIWRFDTDPTKPMRAVELAPVDGVRLHSDAEGLALLPRGRDGGLLFAASQHDDSFSVFRLPGGAYVGAFRINGGTVDGTEETDGIELDSRDFGSEWPGGMFVAQDGRNREAKAQVAAQNFKLVPLDRILRAIGEK